MLLKVRRLLLRVSVVLVMLTFLLSLQSPPTKASCTFEGETGPNCLVQGCYENVYCDAIACFHQAWAEGRNGEECCFYNQMARFCGSDCPLFCAEP